MSFQERRDLGVRVAGEKSQLPDEFITRSQLEAGANIQIEYQPGPSWNIRISATTTGGTGVPIRQIEGEIEIKLPPAGGYGLLVTTANHYYGTARYLDIHHNWDLPDKNAYLLTLVDINGHAGQARVRHSLPKHVGIDTNTVRIWAKATSLAGNADYHFTLMEKL